MRESVSVVGNWAQGDRPGFNCDFADSSDDETAIQAAISALPSQGGRIIIRRGDYTLANQISLSRDDMQLLGEGRDITKITGPATGGLFVFSANRTNIEIAEMSLIDGNSVSAGVAISASSFTITGLFVHDCLFQSFDTSSAWNLFTKSATGTDIKFIRNQFNFLTLGLNLAGTTSNLIVRDNVWTKRRDAAIQLSSSSNRVIISGNIFDDVGNTGTEILNAPGGGSTLVISDNVARAATLVGDGINLTSWSQVTISGNTLDNSHTWFVRLSSCSQVSITGNTYGTTSIDVSFAGIYISNSDEIVVNGNYLRTTSATRHMILAVGTSNDITVSGNVIICTSTTNGVRIDTGVSDVVVNGNFIRVGSNIGIEFRSGASNCSAVSNRVISGNIGIRAQAVRTEIIGNYIQANSDGIFGSGVGSVNIVGNRFVTGTIDLTNSDQTQIVSNYFDTITIAIDITSCDFVSIRNNFFLSSTTGILLDSNCNNVEVIDNRFRTVTTPLSDAGDLTVIRGNSFQHPEVATVDATITTLFSWTLKDETMYLLKAFVQAMESGGDRAAYERTIAVYRTAAGVAIIQGAVQTDFTVESDAAWDCTWDVSGNDVRLRVTGVVATNIDWSATVEFRGST